jgi:hypothetical protein
MLKINGKRFYCSCGCNVFTKYDKEKYRCNSCETCYETDYDDEDSDEVKSYREELEFKAENNYVALKALTSLAGKVTDVPVIEVATPLPPLPPCKTLAFDPTAPAPPPPEPPV